MWLIFYRCFARSIYPADQLIPKRIDNNHQNRPVTKRASLRVDIIHFEIFLSSVSISYNSTKYGEGTHSNNNASGITRAVKRLYAMYKTHVLHEGTVAKMSLSVL